MREKNKTIIALEMILLQRKGGKTSARIIEQILERPYNPNQMSNILNISYNTAYRHFQIMLKHHIVEKSEVKYGACYSATKSLLNEKEEFYRIKELI
ncbi:winged helix-turn-helix domain-containing protein [Methanobrevibacter sp.]|uniref:winged helix-turn-helix domain-containing protein n=1 Tax=Methanobrevibacter sp. TaxID=66852 RepID=UPI00388D8CA8